MSETKQLFLDEQYSKEFDATIIEVINIETSTDQISSKELGNFTYLVFDLTLFYPTGGGQPSDIGKIIYNHNTYEISEVIKREGRILHKVGNSIITSDSVSEFRSGQKVHGIIDWDRRYKLMRMHTASHLLDAVIYDSSSDDRKVMVTGNALGTDKTRIDFNMPDFTLDKIQRCIDTANSIINKDLKVKNYYLKRDEALKIPGIIKLAGALPPSIDVLRITEVEGIDIQADGGTHVKSLKEIGTIKLLDIENKGKDRKRVYFELLNH